MSHSQREETPPTWLNVSFMETALKKGFKNDNFKILESEMKIATAVGDHYGSQMFRFTFLVQKEQGKKETISVIVKSIPPGLIGEELRRLAAFEKEEEAFSRTLPIIHSLLEKAYPGHKKLWADCYYHQGSPNNLLIFEDLRVKGFVLGNRFDGLDLEHSTLVLQSLAKFHAASLTLKKENLERLEFLQKIFWSSDNAESFKNMFTTPFKVLSKDVLKWTEVENRELYSEKLISLEKVLLDKIFQIWMNNDSKIKVFLHGDSWVNNFMFRYDPTGKLSDINFVDFQMININNPTLDLQYFIFTSVNLDYKFTYINSFLEIYYKTFEDTLKRLGHQLQEPYEFEDLKKDFESNYLWGFIVFCTIFPLFMVPQNEVVHPDEFFKQKEGGNFEKMYQRRDLAKVLQKGFAFFDEKGIFQKET